ncbi:phosphatase PAP2 family protein [Nonomuraea sp. NPDC050310]|uniref:phosphatase PAP2 family protein n=1 Tax=Nonomuraea sp. NPDC050310 TaxID=3154935 RepID=UPI0033DC1CC6
MRRDVTGEPPAATGPDRLARWVTELFAPQVLVIAMPPLAGLLAQGWTGAAWGLLASALCGGVPAAVIAMGVRAGRLDSRHLVERAGRTKPLLAAAGAVLAALVLLIVLGAPTLLVATVAAMLGALAVTVPVTLRWKISFHAAVSGGTVVVFAQVLPPPPTLAAGAVLLALVCWARVRLGHHTTAQVLAGLVVGVAVTAATLAAFGEL